MDAAGFGTVVGRPALNRLRMRPSDTSYRWPAWWMGCASTNRTSRRWSGPCAGASLRLPLLTPSQTRRLGKVCSVSCRTGRSRSMRSGASGAAWAVPSPRCRPCRTRCGCARPGGSWPISRRSGAILRCPTGSVKRRSTRSSPGSTCRGSEIIAAHPQPNENAWLLGYAEMRRRRDVGMVGARGFEPPTSSSRTMRATKLRHAPTEGAR